LRAAKRDESSVASTVCLKAEMKAARRVGNSAAYWVVSKAA
jgi:hypothetical protein